MNRSPVELEATLAALFEAELETAIEALTRGLVCLEESVVSPAHIAPMMRAAHAIKGAARIVRIEPAVRLAHALEDFLASVEIGSRPLGSTIVDEVLGVVDALHGLRARCRSDLAGWGEDQGAAVLAIAERISALALEQRAIGGRLGADATPEPSLPPPAPVAPLPVRVVAAKHAPRRESTQENPAVEPAHDRVLRVSARSVQRLMGLAGESLVESRRIPAFAGRLMRLQRRLGALSGRLAEIELLANERSLVAVVEPAKAARAELEEGLGRLLDEIGSVEQYGWRIEDLSHRLYREALESRMRPFRDGVVGLVRMVRELARELGKDARLEVVGEATEVDRDVLEGLEAPLSHLLRNALDHGVEPPDERAAAGKPAKARILLEAGHEAGMLRLRVADDGRGIDLEAVRARALERELATAEQLASLSTEALLELLFLPGFSTATSVTEISGRGVGLDAARTAVESVGGRIRVSSEPGRATVFELRLPVTRSVIRALLVEIAGDRYALPLLRIAEILRVPATEASVQEGRALVMHRGASLALVCGAELMGFETTRPPATEWCVVVLRERESSVGLIVDRFLGEQDLVVQPLEPRLGRVPGIAAGAILADGMPALLPDVEDLFRLVAQLAPLRSSAATRAQVRSGPSRETPAVLVIDDSITVREAERQLLENAGYRVETAADGLDGFGRLRAGVFDLVITDVEMPRMDGIDLVRRIRADDRLRELPVIIVSYKDREEDKLRGLDAGATCYLTKSSFHDRTFIEAVEDVLGPGAS